MIYLIINLIIYQIFQHGHLVLTKWSRLDLLEQGVVDLQTAYGLHSRNVYAWSQSLLYRRMLGWSISPSRSSKGLDSLRGVFC